MAANPIFKKCGCRGPVLDADGQPVLGADGKPRLRRLGSGCPQLRRAGGRWNSNHGSWHFQIEVITAPGAPRAHLTQGGIATFDKAQEAVERVRALPAIADELDDAPGVADALRADIVQRVRVALKARAPLPEVEEIRKAARLGQPVMNKLTVGEWLSEWIGSKTSLSRGTRVSYRGHIDRFLIPHLGAVPLDRLRVAHVHAMFTAIAAEAEAISAANEARREGETAWKTARKAKDRSAVRQWKTELEAMPPFRKPANAATRLRIRATLRSALSAACTQQLITVNVAALADLDPAKRPKALVWTPVHEARWRQTGEVPSAVMVWTGPQTAAFLNRARGHEFFALFHLIAFTGLRRGEAVGLRWVDLDLSARMAPAPPGAAQPAHPGHPTTGASTSSANRPRVSLTTPRPTPPAPRSVRPAPPPAPPTRHTTVSAARRAPRPRNLPQPTSTTTHPSDTTGHKAS
ncbi:MAG: hypothetical protein AUG49_12390 [Catenulispora sp. 13_1_20CM_3_70_7]|nr:MAG: hypothetical protein AUG49_12390 [Catenulispora sp. 13_1_20CM_3_70_7]